MMIIKMMMMVMMMMFREMELNKYKKEAEHQDINSNVSFS